MKALGTQTLALFALLAFATPASAQPLECASSIDNLGDLVADLDGILGVRGEGEYGALSGTLDRDSVRAKISGLSDEKRRELAGKLLTIAQDESLTGECSKDQVRYNAGMVLFELANAETDAAKKQYFIDCLIAATKAEKDPAAQRQMALNLDKLSGAMSDAQKAEAKKLVGEYLPDAPDYSTVFGENGDKRVVNVVVHAGDETFQHSGYDRVFSGPNSKVTKVSEGLWEIEHTVTPDDPTGRLQPVTYKIKLVDEFRGGFSNLDVFSDMDKDDPAIEVYNFHSQYGSGLSKSIREGAENPSSKKIFFLGSCKSKVNAGRIEAKYPKINSIYTRDSEYFVDTPRTLKKMLEQVTNRATWGQISKSLDYANLLNDDNYFFPHDRRKLAYIDSDLDGIPDLHDTGVNCGLEAPPQSNEFAAKRPASDKLSGEKIVYAVTAANGVIGYSGLVSSLEDKFVADGFAPADPNGPRFVFTPARENGPFGARDVVKVKVNAAYSHMSDTAMAGAMLREFVMYDRTKGGTREASLDDKILAYAMGVKLFDAWSGQGGSQAYSEYQKAYNLGRNFSLWEAASKIDHDRGVTRETIDYFKEKLGEGNG